jgi:putative CocE/NonD family hydrolase
MPRRPCRGWVVVSILLAMILGGPPRPARAAAEETAGVDLVWGLKIPLRDGVLLNGTVYKPAGQREPLPVVFTLTPYVGDSYHERGLYFARHGYVFVLVDVRGRGSSGGRFTPFAQEARDGYDAVEFLARQPWANGKVAMWGGSYAGYDQWATLKAAPPHLATIVPAAAVHPGLDFPIWGGIPASYAIQWLTYTSGGTNNRNLFGEFSFWTQKFLDMYRRQARFDSLDRLVGNPSPVFQEWLAHPAYDGYWQAMSPTPEEYRRMTAPILTITGHYDADQVGALSLYREHIRYGDPAARERHFLVIGPWDHAGTRTPARLVGGLDLGDASLVDLNRLHREWYDWTLKGGPRPELLKKRVAYYVAGAGAGIWKYADDLAAVAAERRVLYLTAPPAAGEGAAAASQGSDVFHSGTLDAERRPSPPERWVYDPRDLRFGELEEKEITNTVTDQTAALHLFGAGVVYHSAPFAEATEIAGNVKLSVWLALDVPDADFAASLYEILPDGSSVLLASDQLRARYRESPEREKLVAPGAVERYDFDRFNWFARRIGKGSRLRLVLQSPNSSQVEKNYGSGKAVAAESGADARLAHVALYHDAEHPSVLELPVAR